MVSMVAPLVSDRMRVSPLLPRASPPPRVTWLAAPPVRVWVPAAASARCHPVRSQPLRVRLPDGPQPSADRRLGPPGPGGDGQEPDAAGVDDQGDSIASVLSARRTTTSVGSRIWVAEQSAQRARRGVTVTVWAPGAADDASATGPERAQHTLTTR